MSRIRSRRTTQAGHQRRPVGGGDGRPALPRAHVRPQYAVCSVQADPDALGTTVDAFYATDDPIARDNRRAAVVDRLRPVNVGGLAAARELEALAFLNIRLQMLTGGDWRSAFVLQGAGFGHPGSSPERRGSLSLVPQGAAVLPVTHRPPRGARPSPAAIASRIAPIRTTLRPLPSPARS